MDAYRVDRDHSVDVPIDSIEEGIRNAAVCLADVTADNPNVWPAVLIVVDHPDHQLRTLQRRVRQWRMQRARRFAFGIDNGTTGRWTDVAYARADRREGPDRCMRHTILMSSEAPHGVTDLKSFCRIRGRFTFGWTVDNAGQDQASDGNILAEATR